MPLYDKVFKAEIYPRELSDRLLGDVTKVPDEYGLDGFVLPSLVELLNC